MKTKKIFKYVKDHKKEILITGVCISGAFVLGAVSNKKYLKNILKDKVLFDFGSYKDIRIISEIPNVKGNVENIFTMKDGITTAIINDVKFEDATDVIKTLSDCADEKNGKVSMIINYARDVAK